MRIHVYIAFLFVLALLSACSSKPQSSTSNQSITAISCTQEWYNKIERSLSTSDAQMHGPDVGSEEWKSVIEFKLGIRGQTNIPARDTNEWCQYIDTLTNQSNSTQGTTTPSFSCDETKNQVETLICKTPSLSRLDVKLSRVYDEAERLSSQQNPRWLAAEQRGWIKGRDECWKAKTPDQQSSSSEIFACVKDSYIRRIAALQARFSLVPKRGPVFYYCAGNPANEVVVSFFETTPPTLVAERGDSVALMFLSEDSDERAHYQGRNESFTETSSGGILVWGYDADEMTCEVRKA